MNKEVPVANRLLQRREFQKNNDILLCKLMTIKFSNISSIKTQPSPTKHKPHSRPIQYNKLVNVSSQKHTVKTVLKQQNMRAQNKRIFNRLISQKSTVSAQLFASQRQRNVQFLKRIGKYPYNRAPSIKLEPLGNQQSNERSLGSKTMGDFQQTERINICVSQHSLQKNKTILSHFVQEQRKQCLIVLFSKLVNLGKNWSHVKFLRLKNHYQITLQNYPYAKFEYSLRLQEKIGTSMLSQNDYDYERIYTNFIKFTTQFVCFSFELFQTEKKYFYKFEKRRISQIWDYQTHGQLEQEVKQIKKPKIKDYRKTMFAIQNEKREKEEEQNGNRISRFKTDYRESDNPLRRLERVSSMDITIPDGKL